MLWYLLTRAAVRVPLRPLFQATSLFLLLMAAHLVGAGLQEFQEQALVPFDPAPLPAWTEAVGVSPSTEGLIAQLAVLTGVTLILAWPRRATSPPTVAAE